MLARLVKQFGPRRSKRMTGQYLGGNARMATPLAMLPQVRQFAASTVVNSNYFRDLIPAPSATSPATGQGGGGNTPVTFSVAEIDSDGNIVQRSVTKTSLMNDSKIYARDFISLLSGKSRRTRPDILVRESSIVVCFSHLRAIIRCDRILLFEPEDQFVRAMLPGLAKSIAQKPVLPHPFDYLEDSNIDFELRAMESILSMVCEMYRKRAVLISPLVDGVIRSLGTSKTPLPGALHQLLPMKDHLSNFEIETTMTRDVLTELLKNDEDLLGLLLSEKKRRHGANPPLEAHRSAELMLENYCSQMVDISQEAYFLRKRIESVQSIFELTLDSHRNRLLHLSLQLNMGTISLSWLTAAAGFFGMNLASGLEHVPGAFFSVVVASTTGAGIIFLWMNTLLGRMSPHVDVKHGDFDIVFMHLDEIQSIFENASGDKVLFTKDEFRGAMRALKVSEEVADMVWNSFEMEGQETQITRNRSSRELRKLFDLGFLRRVGLRSDDPVTAKSPTSPFQTERRRGQHW